MKPGTPEWFASPDIPIEEKRRVARLRALSGPNARWWREYYRKVEDDPVLITENGRIIHLNDPDDAA